MTSWKDFGHAVAWLSVAFVTICMAVYALAALTFSWKPRFDDSDPRYADLVRQIKSAEDAFSRGGEEPIILDLGALNAEDWTTACVYGSYNDPRTDMMELGARISDEDAARLEEASTRGARAAVVEEAEAMVAFVDRAGQAQFVHLGHGFGQFAEFGKRCISKPQSRLTLR